MIERARIPAGRPSTVEEMRADLGWTLLLLAVHVLFGWFFFILGKNYDFEVLKYLGAAAAVFGGWWAVAFIVKAYDLLMKVYGPDGC